VAQDGSKIRAEAVRSRRQTPARSATGAAGRRRAPLNTLTAKHLRLTCPNTRRYALLRTLRQGGTLPALVTITLNGEPYQLDGPVSVSTLLASLAIDSRRVAVEHNLVVVRRTLFDSTIVREGDAVEIVNFVGGGAPAGRQHCR
jgi:sulfur carrier protein